MLTSLLTFLISSNAVTLKRDKSILYSRIAIKSLFYISMIAFYNTNIKALEHGIALFGGLFNVTPFTQFFNVFLIIVSALILTITSFYPRIINNNSANSVIAVSGSLDNNTLNNNTTFFKLNFNGNLISNMAGEQFRIIEYALIIVFIISGAVFLMSTADLVSIFLSIELQSYGLYILCTLYRNSESSTSSGLTYFLLGGLSSCFILLGSALLYANSGTTSLDNIYIITSISEIEESINSMYLYQPYYIHLSLIVMSVGFLFKVSAAPFHFWSPDVYDGIPTIVTTYVAIIAKLSIFVFLLELLYYTEYNLFTSSWKEIFILSSLFSLIIGSILGLTQSRIKRLFAYSTISHVGFILLALSINNTESIQSYIFYILQYTLSNLNAFIILLSIGYSLYFYVYKKDSDREYLDGIYKEINNSPIQLINQVKGYFYINPFIAISFSITLFSFVGIPPIIGFFAKQMILSSALDEGYVFMTLVAIITSVIGAGYYLNLIKQMFFFKHDYELNPAIANISLKAYVKNPVSVEPINRKDLIKIGDDDKIKYNTQNISINSSLSTIISVLTLLLILFIYMPGEWFNIVSILTLILFKA